MSEIDDLADAIFAYWCDQAEIVMVPARLWAMSAAEIALAIERNRRARQKRLDDDVPLSYPPPFQDISTLAEHVCLSERTIEAWVQHGKLPPPVTTDGKRLWRWKDVEKALARGRDESAASDDAAKMREAVTAARKN